MFPLPKKTNLRLLARNPAALVRAYRWPLLVLLIGAAADTITTYIMIDRYGVEAELHFVQKWSSMLFGPAAGVPLAKLGQVTFVLLVAAWWRPWCGWILLLCGLLYSLAALSNHFLWF